ncbi:MAG TPA: ATP-binding protein [Methylophaga sp.]|nr:ATP-binding protein [Methylophaga sp.]HEC60131.1 ATP-binding protein [Methylophaga sp.]
MRGNPLGDIRAENDEEMLDKAFLETADYKTLLEASDRSVVVGRRGTGKSALVHQLKKYWLKQPKTFIVSIAPEEDQIIGLRGLFSSFGDNFIHIKAGSKIAWKYALYMELIIQIKNHYKLTKFINDNVVNPHISTWGKPNQNVATKIRNKLKSVLNLEESSESIVADLSSNLHLDEIEEQLLNVIDNSSLKFILLVDRLDEGYSPDNLGVAIVDGFVQSVIDLNSKFHNKIRGIIFLRDNMYRSITIKDPDFTRNIEGQVLRLHWDEYGLFNLVCNRIRIAYNISQENNNKLWSSCTARELKGREGFRLCLKLTLYRPRDILVLLNNAFLNASSQGRQEIISEDIDASAKSISQNRLYDLHKEYESIFPALHAFTSTFVSSIPILSVIQASEFINKVLSHDNHSLEVQRDLAIFENPMQVLQRLYGVGFIGIENSTTGTFVFCHDGRDPSTEVSEHSKLFIHPCYWLALNISQDFLEIEQAEEIYDEYDIEISSISVEQRQARLGKLIEEVKVIKPGREDCHEFEKWCLDAIRLIFAGTLSNIELHSNKNGLQQRDIIATNVSLVPVWKRLIEDYKCRQVVFEIKNYAQLKSDDYRQMNSYLSNDHGTIGFIICRSDNNNLEKGKELNWAQELYFQHKKIVVKLSEKYLLKHLSKQRSPQKHDAANIELNKLVDTYLRQYLIVKSG